MMKIGNLNLYLRPALYGQTPLLCLSTGGREIASVYLNQWDAAKVKESLDTYQTLLQAFEMSLSSALNLEKISSSDPSTSTGTAGKP